MNTIPTSDKVYIGNSKIPKAGRGVFATRKIKKGEIIEKCPVIEIPKHEVAGLKKSVLITYLFYFGKKKERAGIALGFGSIYNHSNKPNALFEMVTREKIIEFVALKKINKDQEITFNYHGEDQRKIPLWFED